MKQPHATPISKLAKGANWIEKAGLLLLITSLILKTTGHPIQLLTVLGLNTMAIAFFLFSFRPLEITTGSDDNWGFKELLGLTILPKVMWIGCAVSAIGVLFYLLNLEGAENMLLIGGFSLLISIALFSLLVLINTQHIHKINPILGRALPLVAVNLYILYF